MSQENNSLSNIIITTNEYIKNLKKNFLLIFIVLFFSAGIGLVYSYFLEDKFEAKYSFMFEEEQSNKSISPYLGIVSDMGIDIGGANSSFSSPSNLIQLLKSQMILLPTLERDTIIDGVNDNLLNHYIRIEGLPNIPAEINVQNKYKKDSIFKLIHEEITEYKLDIYFQNPDSEVLEISFKFKDKRFAEYFTNFLVDEVQEKYTLVRTKKTRDQLESLKKVRDSIAKRLDLVQKEYMSYVDQNTKVVRFSARVNELRSKMEVEDLGQALLGYNNQIRIIDYKLQDKKPLLFPIDKPLAPLENIRGSHAFWIFIFVSLGLFIVLFILLIRITFNKVLVKK